MKDRGAVIHELQVTEKASAMAGKDGKYFFRVARWANKMQIKDAVEKHFKVSVAGVNTMCYSGKRKRERAAKYGKTADWKRAVVTLTEGEKIELV
jgi:large subunit ribosomal protein L23